VVAGGCPDRCEPEDAAARVAYLALDMVAYVEQLAPFNGHKVGGWEVLMRSQLV
jgi:hypothetical protein